MRDGDQFIHRFFGQCYYLPAVGGLLCRGLDSVISRGLFQPLRFCDCVIFQGIFSEYSYSKAALLMLALQSEKLSRYHANNSHRLAFIRAAAIRLHFKIFIYVFSTGLWNVKTPGVKICIIRSLPLKYYLFTFTKFSKPKLTGSIFSLNFKTSNFQFLFKFTLSLLCDYSLKKKWLKEQNRYFKVKFTLCSNVFSRFFEAL